MIYFLFLVGDPVGAQLSLGRWNNAFWEGGEAPPPLKKGKARQRTRKSTWGRCALRWPTQAKGAALWLSTWGRRQVDAPILGLDPGLDPRPRSR